MTMRSDPYDLARALDTAAPRRRLLAGIGALAALGLGGRVAGAACALTPAQTEGPFYPATIGEDDWDLTRVAGTTGRAEGEAIEVLGQVKDVGCRPLAQAIVEVWQASARGVYGHPREGARGRDQDPNFQGYARLTTDTEGRYRFVTVVPGAYPASANWTRPPHIHFKVHAPGGETLITQMYFAGEPLNEQDWILGRLSEAERAAVVVDFAERRADGLRRGRFDPVVGRG